MYSTHSTILLRDDSDMKEIYSAWLSLSTYLSFPDQFPRWNWFAYTLIRAIHTFAPSQKYLVEHPEYCGVIEMTMNFDVQILFWKFTNVCIIWL